MKKKLGLLLMLSLLFTGCFGIGESNSTNSNTNAKKEEKKEKKKKVVTDVDYNIGDVVTVKGEKFYVLEASDKSDNEVVLFAYYNLTKDGKKQAPNASVADTKVEFSSEVYWKKAADDYYKSWANGDDYLNGKTYLDLNDLNGNSAGDAITKAREYAKSLGGSNGRLLTYEEADTLKPNYPDMIGGHGNKQSEDGVKYLNYYLSSVRYYTRERVFTFRGEGEYGGDVCSYADSNYGVRPVITISKSLIDK